MKSLRIIQVASFIFLSLSLTGQVIFDPQYSLKTPPTINIVSIDLGSGKTIINLSIENRVDGGYFCTDKNTFIISGDGEKLKLEKAVGIPYCPDLHKFMSIGEKIYFTLTFPAIKGSSEWFDLVEECGDMCYSVLGISTNQSLNNEMANCFLSLDEGNALESAKLFEALLPGLEKVNHGLTGSVYINLITIYKSLNNEKAVFYTKKLEQSDVPHKEILLKSLKDMQAK